MRDCRTWPQFGMVGDNERKRISITRLPDKSADSVLAAFQKMQSELWDYFGKVFRTITTDNGPEFARLAKLETETNAVDEFLGIAPEADIF